MHGRVILTLEGGGGGGRKVKLPPLTPSHFFFAGGKWRNFHLRGGGCRRAAASYKKRWLQAGTRTRLATYMHGEVAKRGGGGSSSEVRTATASGVGPAVSSELTNSHLLISDGRGRGRRSVAGGGSMPLSLYVFYTEFGRNCAFFIQCNPLYSQEKCFG